MCLYKKLIINPKYKKTKKNGGVIPPILDPRTKYVPIGCGECMECKQQKAREWQVRLLEDIKYNTNGKMVTLTLSNESIYQLSQNNRIKDLKGYKRDNGIATLAVEYFRERWRKEFKKTIRHWLITELGHNGTENIHLHGILWTDHTFQKIRDHWQYGWIWPKPNYEKYHYVNEQTINYSIKYVHKTDEKHPYYKSKILNSPGIGAEYTLRPDSRNNIYAGTTTDETYRTPMGNKIALPIYWRNKIYTEHDRENLWLQRLDKKEQWVMGEKIDISENEDILHKTIQHYQRINMELGYSKPPQTWEEQKYKEQRLQMENDKRDELYYKRIKKIQEKPQQKEDELLFQKPIPQETKNNAILQHYLDHHTLEEAPF